MGIADYIALFGTAAAILTSVAALRRVGVEAKSAGASAARDIVQSANVLIGRYQENIERLEGELERFINKVNEYEERLDRLSKENSDLRADLREMKAGARKLIDQLQGLGEEPVWTMPTLQAEEKKT